MFEAYKAELMLVLKIAVVLGAFCAGVYVTRDHYMAQIGTLKLGYATAFSAAQKAQLAEVQKHQEDLQKGEAQHAKDQLTIGSLAYQLGGVQHISGICSSAAAKADATRKNRDRASGVLPGRVDAAFGRLQEGVGSLAQRCDQLNIDARQHNVEVGNQP